MFTVCLKKNIQDVFGRSFEKTLAMLMILAAIRGGNFFLVFMFFCFYGFYGFLFHEHIFNL